MGKNWSQDWNSNKHFQGDRLSKNNMKDIWGRASSNGISGINLGNNISKDSRNYGFGNYGTNTEDIARSYWDTTNKNKQSQAKNKYNNFLSDAQGKLDNINSVWGSKDANQQGVLEENINNFQNLNFDYDPGYKTNFEKNTYDYKNNLEGFFRAGAQRNYESWNKQDQWSPVEADSMFKDWGFDGRYLREKGFGSNKYRFNNYGSNIDRMAKDGGWLNDLYKTTKTDFIDSYYDNFETGGWEGVLSNNNSDQYVNFLNRFGAQNAQDGEVMALLGFDMKAKHDDFIDEYGYSTNEDYSIGDTATALDKMKSEANRYFDEKSAAEERLGKLPSEYGTTDADILAQNLKNFDNDYTDFIGGNEQYFSDFFDKYGEFNNFSDTMRGNAGSLEEQLNQLGIRDIDALREGRSSIDDYMDQINNFDSDLTGLNSSELLNEFNDLLYQNTEDGRGGFQGLIDEWGMEDNKINTARGKLGGRDEQLAEMLAKLGIYNKDSLDLFQDNFDQLDKYRSDYDGDDKFTSKLDFDFSNEFSDIDSVMSDYMGKYDQRQSELDSLFMKDGTSLEDRLSGTAENDLDGFTELRKLLNQNKNELGKFTGDDLADETSLFDGLFDTTGNATDNIFDQREGVESTLTDLLDQIKNDNFYSEDDLTDYRGLLSSNNDLIDYWGANGAKDEAGLLNEKITGESNRLVQEDKNVASYRQSQKEIILELMRKSGGKLEFNDLPFNDMSDAEIARLFMGTRENFDDPNKLKSIFSQIGGS